jgi:hypothetical protein
VLRGLDPQEAEVALVWAADPHASWREAAAMVGHPNPKAFGDRVRRKLKRRGIQHAERTAAAASRSAPCANRGWAVP